MSKKNIKMKSKEEATHFFKIIFDKTLQERKLRIPPSFVRKYGNDIPSKIAVKDPAGTSWTMGVSRCRSSEVWIQDGWDKFAEHYSLRYAHFLVFRYEGNGHFHVTIFDTSASEINYPYYSRTPSGAPGSKSGFQEHDKDDVEFLGTKTRRGKPGENSPLPFALPSKKMRLRSMNEDITDSISAENNRDFGPSKTSAKGTKDKAVPKPASNFKMENGVRRLNQCSLYAQRKAEALQRAQAFVSENPFCIVVMASSTINPAGQVGIPIAFARRYLSLNLREVVLQVSNRTWTVKYKLRMSKGRIRHSTLSSNWKSFVQDNNLKPGDVCVFELLKGGEIVLKVTIFRVMEDAHIGLSGSSKGNGMEQANDETSSSTEAKFDAGFDIEKSPYKSFEVQEHQFPHGTKTEETDDDVSVEILDDDDDDVSVEILDDDVSTSAPSVPRTATVPVFDLL